MKSRKTLWCVFRSFFETDLKLKTNSIENATNASVCYRYGSWIVIKSETNLHTTYRNELNTYCIFAVPVKSFYKSSAIEKPFPCFQIQMLNVFNLQWWKTPFPWSALCDRVYWELPVLSMSLFCTFFLMIFILFSNCGWIQTKNEKKYKSISSSMHIKRKIDSPAFGSLSKNNRFLFQWKR